MDNITIGLFHDRESAENAINDLSHNGFPSKDIHIVIMDQAIGGKVCKNTGAQIETKLIAGLIGLGLSEDDAKIYEADIKKGYILLGIPTSDKTIKQILKKNQAKQIRSINRTAL